MRNTAPDYDDPNTPAMLEYLGEIYRLAYDDRAPDAVTTSAIADRLNVSPPAAVKMMQKLAQMGYLERRPYKGVQLTPKGEALALRNIRRHRLVEAFLVRVMKFGWHEVHDYAHQLEPSLDERLEDRMDELAGFPTRCPHGDPIPTRDGKMPILNDMPLADFPLEQTGVIGRIKTRQTEKLLYLAEHQIVPGKPFVLAGRAPFGGPVRLTIDNNDIVVGSELAAEIYVEPA